LFIIGVHRCVGGMRLGLALDRVQELLHVSATFHSFQTQAGRWIQVADAKVRFGGISTERERLKRGGKKTRTRIRDPLWHGHIGR